MNKKFIIFLMLFAMGADVVAAQMIPLATVALRTVMVSPAVIVPAVHTVRHLHALQKRRDQKLKEPIFATKGDLVKTVEQLRLENERHLLELENVRLQSKIKHEKEKQELELKQKRADLLSARLSNITQASFNILLWSVRLFGFKTPFGNDD